MGLFRRTPSDVGARRRSGPVGEDHWWDDADQAFGSLENVVVKKFAYQVLGAGAVCNSGMPPPPYARTTS